MASSNSRELGVVRFVVVSFRPHAVFAHAFAFRFGETNRWRVVATLKICYDCYDWNAAFQKSADGGA